MCRFYLPYVFKFRDTLIAGADAAWCHTTVRTMQLYIRGAWKTFSGRPEGSVDNRVATQQQRLFHRIEEDLNGLSVHPGKKGDDGVPFLLPMVIFTENLPQLQRFYLAFADRCTASQDGKNCVLSLGNKQYIVLVNRERDERGQNKQYPEVGYRHTDRVNPRTKRPHKTVALSVSSIEALLISYGRIKDHGIVPVQTSLHGTRIVLQFEDPDGNVVKLCSDIPNLADCSDLIGKDGSFERDRSMVDVNSEALMERLQLWEANSKDAEPESDMRDSACVKLESIMAE